MKLAPVVFMAFLAAPMSRAQEGGAPASAVPFDLDKRPMPSGSDLETLLPRVVGTFKRPPLAPGLEPPTNQDLNVTYTSGSDSVNVGFSMPEKPEYAHDAIQLAKDEATGGEALHDTDQYVVGKEPSYFRTADFIAWSRGRYFYYAKASSAAALEAFMKAFPY